MWGCDVANKDSKQDLHTYLKGSEVETAARIPRKPGEQCDTNDPHCIPRSLPVEGTQRHLTSSARVSGRQPWQ